MKSEQLTWASDLDWTGSGPGLDRRMDCSHPTGDGTKADKQTAAALD